MRVFTVTADVVMGLILGLFLYVLVSRTWTSLQGPWVAVAILGATLLVVLFRRPDGSLAQRPDQRSK